MVIVFPSLGFAIRRNCLVMGVAPSPDERVSISGKNEKRVLTDPASGEGSGSQDLVSGQGVTQNPSPNQDPKVCDLDSCKGQDTYDPGAGQGSDAQKRGS